MSLKNKYKKNLKGFTLLEVLIVLFVVGIVAGVITPLISTALDSWIFQKAEIDLLFSSRLSMNRMVREIRQIKNAAYITTFTATKLEFQDINDNVINFQQVGNSLLRNSNELTDKLKPTGGLNFTYLDNNGDVATVKEDISMVRVKLILESGDNNITIQSLSRLRNLIEE